MTRFHHFAFALGAVLCLGSAGAFADMQKELSASKSKARSCHGRCNFKFPGGMEDENRRCQSQCAGEAEARDAGIRDRSSADQSVQRAGRGAKAEGPIKGKPGPVAEKRKALAAYNRALAILRGASKIGPGRAGYMGDTVGQERKLASLKESADSGWDGTRFVYDVVLSESYKVIAEYGASLKAPRYRGE